MIYIMENPPIRLKKPHLLVLLTVLCPLLSFLTGSSLDIYAPSLPSIARYYHVIPFVIKTAINVSIFSFCLGYLVFGTLIDSIGRKPVFLFGLSLYILVTLITPWMPTIQGFFVMRFLQGMALSIAPLTARILLKDHFSGSQLSVVLVYNTLGYGAGPVFGPFIGSLLYHAFGWRASFIGLAMYAGLLLGLSYLFVGESLKKQKPFSFNLALKNYKDVLSRGCFYTSSIIMSAVLITNITFPTIGPFIVEYTLHKSPLAYGYYALWIGVGYVIGIMGSRVLLHWRSPRFLAYIGFLIMGSALLLQATLASWPLSPLTLVMPIVFIFCGMALFLPYIFTTFVNAFPDQLGVAGASQSCVMSVLAFGGIAFINQFNVSTVWSLFFIYGTLTLISFVLFMVWFRHPHH